jgi:hypothetical protein
MPNCLENANFVREIKMRKFGSLFGAISGVILLIAMSAVPAHAQATRTWVSGVGDDANPCSRTAPCKTFAGAISKTATGGYINCLDPGGFGTLTIAKSITVACTGALAGVLSSGGINGFIVNLPANGKAVIQGISIEGAGTTPGLNGVKMIGAGTLMIIDSVIRDFSNNGVECVGTAGATCILIDSKVINNGGGLNVAGASGASAVGRSVGTVYENNPNFGVQVTSPSKLILTNNTMLGAAAGINNIGGAAVNSFVDNAVGGTGAGSTNIPRR